MTSTKQDNRFNNILKDLASDDAKKVSTAIKQLRKHGKSDAILPLIDVLATSENEIIKQEITSFLFDLKDESAIAPLLSAIENEKYSTYKNVLLSVFWEASLDASEHISFFVKQAINGDYISCLECLTVIENFDATFKEEDIEDLKFDLDEAIENNDEKQDLLISLKASLDTLNVEF